MPGRCSGCGEVGSPCRVRAHIMDCDKWQVLYRTDPAKALDPVADYALWKAGGKKAARAAELDLVIAETERRRTAMHDRFARPADILE